MPGNFTQARNVRATLFLTLSCFVFSSDAISLVTLSCSYQAYPTFISLFLSWNPLSRKITLNSKLDIFIPIFIYNFHQYGRQYCLWFYDDLKP